MQGVNCLSLHFYASLEVNLECYRDHYAVTDICCNGYTKAAKLHTLFPDRYWLKIWITSSPQQINATGATLQGRISEGQ